MGVGWFAFLTPCSWAQALPDPGVAPAPLEAAPAEPPPPVDAPPLLAPRLLAAPTLEPVSGAEAGGEVLLLLLIDEAGAVETVTPVSEAQTPAEAALQAAALGVAASLRFEPAREGEQSVAVEMAWTLSFPAAAPPDPPLPPAPTLLPAPDEGLVATFFRPGGPPVIRRLSAEEIAVIPGTLGDPVRAVSNMPGVLRTPLEAGWLLVRGGGPGDTGLFVDGVRVPLVYHLGGLTSAVHPAFIDDLSFIPSGQPPRYGHATSGVLDLRTAAAAPETRAEATVDLVSSGAYASARVGRQEQLGIQLAVRRSYLDAILGLLPGLTEQQASIAPRFWDWGARADLGAASLFAFGYDDSIDVPNDDVGATVTLRQGTRRVHLAHTLALGARELALSGFAAREWALIDADELSDERLSQRGGGRVELPDPGSGDWGWSAGLDGELGRWEMSVNGVQVGGLFGSVDPYATLRLGAARALTVSARLETLFLPDQLARAAPSGSLGLRVPLSAPWTATADLGLYHGWPPFDVTLGLPGGAYLPLPRAWGGGVGLQRAGGGPVEAEVDLWARALDRIAVLEDDSSLGQGRGVAAGAEALLNVAAGPWTSRTCLTLSRSLRQDEPGHPWEPYTFDQPLLLQTVLAWAMTDAWTLAGRFRVASGYPRDPEVEEAYDILRAEARSLEAWPERLPSFHALDLKLSRQIEARRWALEGYLDIQNVYNRRIPEPAITGVTWQPIFYSYGLPVLPILGVKGSFTGD